MRNGNKGTEPIEKSQSGIQDSEVAMYVTQYPAAAVCKCTLNIYAVL